MYLGLDLGTSGVKAMLIDDDQSVVGTASALLEVSRPAAGWSEQDPADWIAASQNAIDGLSRDHATALAAVRGIGLSGQMHGATLLDASDAVLRPAILWNDTRSHVQAARLDADPLFRATTGNIVFPGFTAPKLAWLRESEPGIFASVAKVLLPKDYLRLWLTGEHVTDMSDASGTAWLDVAARNWSPQLLAATGLGEEHMPRLVEGSERSGSLRAALAARWGMAPGVAVAGGAGDNAASAIGMGAVAEGASFVSLGTSGVLFVATETFRPKPESAVHAFCHALPQTWHQMGVILSATDSLNWLAGLTGREASALTAALGETLRAPGPVTFLPYLSGERTPHNDATIRGAFTGLDQGSGPEALARAVLEGVAFALKDNLEALREAGSAPASLTAVGGGSRSDYWLRLIATVLGLPVSRPAEGDFGAAFGAARLGLIAAENADPHLICRPPRLAATFDPDPTLVQSCTQAWRGWRALYPALRNAGR